MRWRFVVILLLLFLIGCSRSWYRRDADRETYPAILERNELTWQFPSINLSKPPASRLHDPYNPDRSPRPPDDPTANGYMQKVFRFKGYRHWDDHGVLDSVEDPTWLELLQREPDGTVLLTPERSVELGQLNSREYQTTVEALYLNALSLTLNRFEFSTQWFLTGALFYDHSGASSLPNESNTLSLNSNFGFSQAFAAGGQLFVDLANSMVWQYTGRQEFISSNLAITFVQPLLRRAGREVRLESLTQGERDLLYAVRDFARFRKQFYLNVAVIGYRGLLLQLQSIRNLESNLISQEQNLRLHDALYAAGEVSLVQVDQVFLSYQQAKVALLQARTNLENSFDGYKFTLGLPPALPIRLDDGLLQPFQFNSKEISDLQENLDQFLSRYREKSAAPNMDELRKGFEELLNFYQQTEIQFREVASEHQNWAKRIGSKAQPENDEARRELQSLETLKKQLDLVAKDMPIKLRAIQTDLGRLREANRQQDWERLQRRTREMSDLVSQLFVIQTQIRVFAVQLTPFPFKEPEAVRIALDQRLDLKNERARVVDAWRKITVAADGLEPGLNLVVNANLNNETGSDRLFDFSAQASRYRVGMQFDGPLNRQAERNSYRASLITYQRARRLYMASEDQIVQSIRRNLRQLETDRLNFNIARQSLIAAARQVEATRERLLLGGQSGPQTGTLDILRALDSLLAAKQTLISIWVSYEIGRQQLLFDLELLELDDRGFFSHESPFGNPTAGTSPAP